MVARGALKESSDPDRESEVGKARVTRWKQQGQR